MNMECLTLPINFIYTVEVHNNQSVLCVFDESEGGDDCLPVEAHPKHISRYLKKLLPELPEQVVIKDSRGQWNQLVNDCLVPIECTVTDGQFPQWYIEHVCK